MNFLEVTTEILSSLKRPDKLSDIKREINSAINFCCLETSFARDLVEATVSIPNTDCVGSIALSTLTRFRKFKYIRPVGTNCYLDPVPPDRIFQGGREQVNTYYVSGDNVIYRLSKLNTSLLVGYYTYPIVLSADTDTHWLLGISPYMIINRALQFLFAGIGDDTSAKHHASLFSQQYISARADYTDGVGLGR